MDAFKDHFSKQSEVYAMYRPGYPKELFEFLASLTTFHDLAWDCGTGNGQAAIRLAELYDRVHATDASAAQIKNAAPHERVRYLVEKSETVSLPDHSVDLVTVANALHWFDFDSFYKEVRRVLKPNGIFVAWCYALPRIEKRIDEVVLHFHNEVVGKYWLPESNYVLNKYADIPFPFPEMKSPDFYYDRKMDLDDMIGYFNTWSATQRFIEAEGFNPTEGLRRELEKEWNAKENKILRWDLPIKLARVN